MPITPALKQPYFFGKVAQYVRLIADVYASPIGYYLLLLFDWVGFASIWGSPFLSSTSLCCSLKKSLGNNVERKRCSALFWNYTSPIQAQLYIFISSLIIFKPAHSLLYKKKGAGSFPRTWNMRAFLLLLSLQFWKLFSLA